VQLIVKFYAISKSSHLVKKNDVKLTTKDAHLN